MERYKAGEGDGKGQGRMRLIIFNSIQDLRQRKSMQLS